MQKEIISTAILQKRHTSKVTIAVEVQIQQRPEYTTVSNQLFLNY